jgi:hypothetical protein
MPPRHELNVRFQAHVRRARLARRLSAAALSVCLLVGAGAAIAKLSPSTIAAATAPFSNVAAAASAGASSALDHVTSFFRNIFHGDTTATSPTQPENWKKQPPSQFTGATSTEPPSQPATSSEPLTLQSKAPTPYSAPSGASASALAVSNSSPHSGRVLGATTEPHIVERIIETIPNVPGATLDDLLALEARINQRIDAIVSPPPFPQQVGGNGSGGYFAAPAASQRIDQLTNVTLNNPTIIGGSLSGTSGVGGGSIGDRHGSDNHRSIARSHPRASTEIRELHGIQSSCASHTKSVRSHILFLRLLPPTNVMVTVLTSQRAATTFQIDVRHRCQLMSAEHHVIWRKAPTC